MILVVISILSTSYHTMSFYIATRSCHIAPLTYTIHIMPATYSTISYGIIYYIMFFHIISQRIHVYIIYIIIVLIILYYDIISDHVTVLKWPSSQEPTLFIALLLEVSAVHFVKAELGRWLNMHGRCHPSRLKTDETFLAFHFLNFLVLQHSPDVPMCRPNSHAWWAAVAAVFGPHAITSSNIILTIACLDLLGSGDIKKQERMRDWRWDPTTSVISWRFVTYRALPCVTISMVRNSELHQCDRTEMQEKVEWQCTECTRLLSIDLEIMQLFEFLPCFQMPASRLTFCFPQVTYHLVANLDKPAFKAYCTWKAYGEAGTVRHIAAAAHSLLKYFQVQ